MSCSDKEKLEFLSLVNKSIEGKIAPEEVQQLNELMFTFNDLKDLYLKYIELQAVLYDKNVLADFDSTDMPFEKYFWSDLVLEEENAPAFEIPQEVDESKEKVIIKHNKPYQTSRFYKIYSTIISIAAVLLIMFIIYANVFPPEYSAEVATVSDQIGVRWGRGSKSLSINDKVLSNQSPYIIEKGIIKIIFDHGVDVLIEGPAEFAVERQGLYVEHGRLYAMVSKSGRGFTIDTPNIRFVDLGTEFGVEVNTSGISELHVLKGKVQLFAGVNKEAKSSQLVRENEAVQYVAGTGKIDQIPIRNDIFVRSISSASSIVWRGQRELRLADILLSGNGLGTATRQIIEYEPVTGEEIPTKQAIVKYREGKNEITSIPDNPFIDCIFVPGTDGKNVVVSSEGHIFGECPETTGLYYSNVVCRKDWKFFDPLQQIFEQTKKRFADSGLLYLHSNVGITIDLNAVREVIPDMQVTSFSTYAGIVQKGKNSPDSSEVDVWVLIDGQLRSSIKALRADKGFDVSLELTDSERFLTLIVTDSGKKYSKKNPANHFDTCGFAEPVFGLMPQ